MRSGTEPHRKAGWMIRKNLNPNDHVISFYGNLLGISNQDKNDHNSKVYFLPLGGGTPKQVTDKGPSYLHGWSTDGKSVVYTGARNNEFDVYRKSRITS